MGKMSIRATYALDRETSQRIRELANAWHVSQAEVVRRAVRTAAEQERESLTPADVVAHYVRSTLPRSREETRLLVEQLRDWRHVDDDRRGQRH